MTFSLSEKNIFDRYGAVQFCDYQLEDIISFGADVTTCFHFCVIFISGNCVFACLLLEKGQIWQVFASCLLMLMVMQCGC